MKHILVIAAAFSLFGLNSCKKCTDCTCTSTISYEFNGYTTEEENAIISVTDNAYALDYPDGTTEVCDNRGKKYKDAVSEFEAKSDLDTLSSGNAAKNYNYEWVRTCSCE